MRTQGKELKVRWSTEEWTPTIKLVVSALTTETQVEALTLELPLFKRRVRRQRPVLWTRSGARASGLSGLDNSRTSWR